MAVRANALMGHDAAFDQALARLNTRAGDALVLAFMGLLFLAHALCGGDARCVIRRLAFWGWIGAICVGTYALQNASEEFLKRPPPFRAIPQLLDVQATYGIQLRGGGGSAFPSGHAFAYMFFALMAWRRYAPMGKIIGALGVVMVGARLALGIHWLSDVVLGALPLAALMAALARETALARTRRPVERTLWRVIRRLRGLRPLRKPPQPSRAGESA